MSDDEGPDGWAIALIDQQRVVDDEAARKLIAAVKSRENEQPGVGGTIVLGGIPTTADLPGNLYFESGSGRPGYAFGDIVFRVGHQDVIRLKGDLTIEVRGVATEAPADVVAALREWLAGVKAVSP